MRIFMCDFLANYGDVLNGHIWPHYFKKFLERKDNVLMFGIGTLLGQNISHEGNVIVCGSGCGYEPDVSVVSQYKIFWVRGPNSAHVLGLSEDTAITDPAILVGECFPPVPASNRVAFMPHWETSLNPLWRRVCRLANIDYIDPLDDVKKVSAQLSGAKLVIAEAMHGAIVADAYRVPWIPVATSSRVNLFKWHDWAASLELTPAFHKLAPLGVSDVFRGLTSDAKTANELRQLLSDKMNIPVTIKRTFGSYVLRFLNLTYNCTLPRWLRYKIEYRLCSKIGPRIDGWIDRCVPQDKPTRRMRHLAKELSALAEAPGYLSSDSVFAKQKSRVLNKIVEIQEYLENLRDDRTQSNS